MFMRRTLCIRSISPLINRVMIQECNKRALNSLPIASNIFADNHIKLGDIYPLRTIIRHKSKKAAAADSDDEDYLDDDKSLAKDSKVVKFTTTSLRTDAVLKSGLGIARNKIEQLFYESKIRVNGRKILKKSTPVREDYEIDVVKQVSPKNPEHLYVARVEVMNITAKEENIQFTVRRFKNLLIENYEEDPYKSGDTQGNE